MIKPPIAKLTIVVVLLVIGIALANTAKANNAPVASTQSIISATFTEENPHTDVVVNTARFGARDADGDLLTFDTAFNDDCGDPEDGCTDPPREKFYTINSADRGTTSTQWATIRFRGGELDYENAPVFDDTHGNGRRAWRYAITAYDGNGGLAEFEFRAYIRDTPEVSNMHGKLEVSPHNQVGSTVTVTSRLGDHEGLNSQTWAWSRSACPTPKRGLGRWSVPNRIGGSNSDSYTYVTADGDRVISAWAQYKTDTNNYKWVCEEANNGYGIIPAPPPENSPPIMAYGPVSYYVEENSPTGVLTGETIAMFDIDQETIRYSIVIPEGTPTAVANQIRSTFRIRSTAPNPSSYDSAQPIEVSFRRRLNYETTRPLSMVGGTSFDIKGCDAENACETTYVEVYVTDIPELSSMSGSPRISGDYAVGSTLTADFSNVRDTEGMEYLHIEWRRGGRCTATKGMGELPEESTSGDGIGYYSIGNGNSVELTAVDADVIVSVWGTYFTETGHKKWVCASGSRSLQAVRVTLRALHSTVPAGEPLRYVLTRTNGGTEHFLVVSLTGRENWVENGQPRENDLGYFTHTIPAGKTQFEFERHFSRVGGTVTLWIRPRSHYQSISANAVVTVKKPNRAPSGEVTISGTPRAGQTLTADVSAIKDDNNKSDTNTDGSVPASSFSYIWWKAPNYGSNKGTYTRISGATRSTYRVRAADVRHNINVRASYTDAGGYANSKESRRVLIAPSAANPYIIATDIQDRSNGELVPPRSTFDLPKGQGFNVVVHMSEEIRFAGLIDAKAPDYGGWNARRPVPTSRNAAGGQRIGQAVRHDALLLRREGRRQRWGRIPRAERGVHGESQARRSRDCPRHQPQLQPDPPGEPACGIWGQPEERSKKP